MTLGEANTPLLSFRPADGDRAPCWLKAEHLNPTLSFKDRAMALGVSFALDHGAPGLVLASTGNAAVSAAAYAAAAGLPCRIVCGSASGAQSKTELAEAYGADITVVDGDYSAAYAAAAAAEREGWFNVTTTYRNPILAEAYRSIAAEIVHDLGRTPNQVVVPVGAGPLLYGLHQGFGDLVRMGLTSALPRMVGVQSQACQPLVDAWESDDWHTSLATPPEVAPTMAAAIADPLRGYEAEGLITLAAAGNSAGTLIAVPEQMLLAAHGRLVAAGHLAEVSSAAAVAALERREVDGVRETGDIVVVITGHGAKEGVPCR